MWGRKYGASTLSNYNYNERAMHVHSSRIKVLSINHLILQGIGLKLQHHSQMGGHCSAHPCVLNEQSTPLL